MTTMTTTNAAEEMQLFVYFCVTACLFFWWIASAGPDRGLVEFEREQRQRDNKKACTRLFIH
jgi:hypothetical protein